MSEAKRIADEAAKALGRSTDEPGTARLAKAIEEGRLPDVSPAHETEHCPACGSANVEIEYEVQRPEPDCNVQGGRAAYLYCREPNCGESTELEHLWQTWAEYKASREPNYDPHD